MAPIPVESAKVIRVIVIQEVRGDGSKGDPFRMATSYWSMDGERLAERDPIRPDRSREPAQMSIPNQQNEPWPE